MNSVEKSPMQEELDSLLLDVFDNLDSFIESINCIKETYEFSEITLRAHQNEAAIKYDSFFQHFERKDVDGRSLIEVPEERYRELARLQKKKSRAERAFELVPPSYFVSLVSVYDSFFGGLVRCLYNICPEKLQEDTMTFCYRDLQEFENLLDVKKRIIDKRVEGLLRDSHVAQIDWLAKALDVNTLKAFNGWADFVEVTERRNLFVHANGTVSTQYIDNCRKHGALLTGILEGNRLTVDKPYFDKAFKTLYKMAIMLSQMLLRVKYCEKFGTDSISYIDKSLIGNVFDLIVDKHYDVAIDISEMVLNNSKFGHNAFDRMYIVLNYAQAYKWSGDSAKCLDILGQEDWTAFTNELLIPKYTLEENYSEVYKRMRELGKSNQHINISSYREWPIFQQLREQKEFDTVFSEIFGEELGGIKTVEVGDSADSLNQYTTNVVEEGSIAKKTVEVPEPVKSVAPLSIKKES